MKKNPKFDIDDLVDICEEPEKNEDARLNPWRVREIKISKTEISYSLYSKGTGTGYYEDALKLHQKNPVILMRTSQNEEEEEAVAKKYFDVYNNRCAIPENSLVVGRYSTLPFYKELEADLAEKNCQLINSYSQHRWIADLKNWYEDLKEFTPKTWFKLADIPDNVPVVLKGETNSKKFNWNTHMFANNKKDAIQVYSRLMEDSMISQQEIVIRQFVPLRKIADGLNGLNISEEYRLFVLNGKVISGGFYWSSHIDDLSEDVLKSLSWKNIPESFLNKVLPILGCNAPFVVVDIARTADDRWIVVEVNDAQHSGLSENDPNVIYENLKKSLNFS